MTNSSTATPQNSAPSTIAFLGTGNMNGAILRGLLAAGHPVASVRATTRSAASATALAQDTGVEVRSTEQSARANDWAIADADVVVLGVKPVGIAQLCQEIAPALRPETVVVSVAAAITLAAMEAALPQGQPVVRSMPNTPLQVGAGVVGLARGTAADDAAVALATGVFEASGQVFEVPEQQIDVVAAVSGSGPAYAFYLAEAMADGGVALGLDPELARRLASATVAGAGKMLSEPGVDPAALRKAVTSPKGTTERAIDVFDAQGVRQAIAAGEKAATDRARQLSAELA
ncbi:pyrroline-5-carboxylate reductase [Galactobacter caseinivorans]|uniref:Pyrroline-5-carboxylate reductase n=1 Tax=Galactobacter caseinivorans TaxID=2676123 RepID=A0A496PLA9_9MICC|nr:pyrroline-5-carboxylate reductase [Galactobacter caseinivorans]RKW71338.1 pyrroline-5-carboxylate reductase [Galactobacter caseinivorans]